MITQYTVVIWLCTKYVWAYTYTIHKNWYTICVRSFMIYCRSYLPEMVVAIHPRWCWSLVVLEFIIGPDLQGGVPSPYLIVTWRISPTLVTILEALWSIKHLAIWKILLFFLINAYVSVRLLVMRKVVTII